MHTTTGLGRRLVTWTAVLAMLGVLAAVFLAYLHPSMVVDLANRLWSCF